MTRPPHPPRQVDCLSEDLKQSLVSLLGFFLPCDFAEYSPLLRLPSCVLQRARCQRIPKTFLVAIPTDPRSRRLPLDLDALYAPLCRLDTTTTNRFGPVSPFRPRYTIPSAAVGRHRTRPRRAQNSSPCSSRAMTSIHQISNFTT